MKIQYVDTVKWLKLQNIRIVLPINYCLNQKKLDE